MNQYALPIHKNVCLCIHVHTLLSILFTCVHAQDPITEYCFSNVQVINDPQEGFCITGCNPEQKEKMRSFLERTEKGPISLTLFFAQTYPVVQINDHLQDPCMRALHLDHILLGDNTISAPSCPALNACTSLKLTNICTNAEKGVLNIGHAPQLKELVMTEKPNPDKTRTMQVSVTGNCPQLTSIILNTQWAKNNLRGKNQEQRRQIVTHNGGTVSPTCKININ